MSRERMGRGTRPAVGAGTPSWDLGVVLLGEATLLLLMTIGGDAGYLQVPRTILALVATLFVPGYALAAALLPRGSELDGPERLAASFGLSWTVIPPIALLLDRSPWGLRPLSTVSALALFSLVCLAVARYRRRAIARGGTPLAGSTRDFGGWGRSRTKRRRVLLGTLGIFTAALLVAALVTVTGARSSGSGTEFYLLGSEGLAEGYPREARVGEPVVVTVGIASHEARPTSFRVEATEGGRPIGQSQPMPVEPSGDHQFRLSFTPVSPSEDEQITISLYREGESNAYRTLLLWLNVAPLGQPVGAGSELEGEAP